MPNLNGPTGPSLNQPSTGATEKLESPVESSDQTVYLRLYLKYDGGIKIFDGHITEKDYRDLQRFLLAQSGYGGPITQVEWIDGVRLWFPRQHYFAHEVSKNE